MQFAVSIARGHIRSIFLFLVSIFLCQHLYSLDPHKPFIQYMHYMYTTENGMPQNSVNDILQSRDGYIWFTTQEGLVRFDGLQFKIFNRQNTPALSSNFLISLIEDSTGNLWFRQVNGDVVRNSGGVFKRFSGIATGRGVMYASHDGTLWIFTENGITRIKNDSVTTIANDPSAVEFATIHTTTVTIWAGLPKKFPELMDEIKKTFPTFTLTHGMPSTVGIRRIVQEDSEGAIWFATKHGLLKEKNGTFTTYTTANGLSDNDVRVLFKDSHGTLWAGTANGLNKIRNGKFEVFKTTDSRSDNSVLGIYEDREGTLWIFTDRSGIKRLTGKTYESYTQADGLSNNFVTSLLEDKEGSLWLGTDGSGLNKLQDGKFVNITSALGMSSDGIFSVTEDASGNLWMATFDGVSEFIPKKGTIGDGRVKNYSTRDGLPPIIFGAVLASRYGGIWVGTTKGLYKIVDGKVTQPPAAKKIVSQFIDCLMEDREGNLWAGGDSGISRISRSGVKNFTPQEGLTAGVVGAAYEDHKGNIWVGIRNTEQGLNIIQHDSVKHIALPEGFVPSFAFYEDQEQTMWIGSAGNGLYRYKDGTFTSYTPSIGLYDYNVYTVLEDQFGYLWMDCNRGIFKVNKKELNDYADGKISLITSTAYTTADGMKSSECDGATTPSAWKTRSGVLCFPTVKGVAMINPAELTINTIPPAVVIDEAIADGKEMKKDGTSELKAGTNKLEFHYAGISFIGPEKVHYKYQLEGYDKDWVDAETRRDAYYTNLSPGHYTFKVIAANNDGVWNETGASIAFYLRPFFYQTGWFLGICIFGFVAVGPGIYLFRVRQLKQRQLELTRLVREKTKEIQSEKEKTEQAFQEAEQHRHEAEKALKELQETQRQLVLSEKMASLGQLTAGIAHEIKNPLNFVNNFASLSIDLMEELQEEFKKKEDTFDAKTKENIEELMTNLRQNVTKINEHGKRADSIVKGMLLHSRGKAGERQETDLNALLSEYVNLAYHGMRAIDSSFNVTFENSYDEKIGKVNVVPQDLSRAFLNIVNNACYSANEKKKKNNGNFSPTVRVTSKNLGDSFEVRVRDNGNGIPQSVLDKIFNPFFTTKPAGIGTGLGLSLTYDIITQEHKGKIEVNTQEGEFAEFILTIPKL